MIGGGAERGTHSVEVINMRRSTLFKAQAVDYRITLKDMEGKTYQQVCKNFLNIMKQILDDVLENAKPVDMVRFNVVSSKFNGNNINTKFQARSQIAPDYIAALIDKTMQSNDTIDMSDDFILNIVHVDIPEGGANMYRMRDPNMLMNLVKRKCALTGMKDWFSEDTDPNIHCFAYALAVALKVQVDGYEITRNWSRCRYKVIDAVRELHAKADVPPGFVSAQHFEAFNNNLPDGYRLVIVDALCSKGLLYKGRCGTKDVCLLYYNKHYLPLKSIATWFAQTYYCVDCEVGTNSKNHHKCKSKQQCHKCKGERCLKLAICHCYCRSCHGMFRNPECKQDHLSNGICGVSVTCNNCGEWFSEQQQLEKHQCGGVTCCYCQKIHAAGDGCFITPSISNQKDTWRYLFYDMETYQDVSMVADQKQHRVNYAVAMSYCSDCTDTPCQKCCEVHHFSGLNGEDALLNFCIWATSDPINYNTTFLAHNSKGFDGYFILDYLVTQGNTPNVIMQGGKILSMQLANIKARFIENMSFLNMPLSQFTETFNIPDTEKGTFPHLFNLPENYNYDGVLPPLEYYDPDSLKEGPRRKLLEWHINHCDNSFNFKRELSQYCEADVALLKAGCIKFRKNFLSSTGVDPFQQVTIASACMEVFRRNFLTANMIGK